MGKAVVLKPVVWSENGYLRPSGVKSASGYAHDHGYGHEEWNGNPAWIWDGWRVFHTEAQKVMYGYAERGDLGIIMTARHGGRNYAVGAAACVFSNSDEDREAIADALDLRANEEEVWAVPAVQAAHGSRSAFRKHWLDAYKWVQWRCPPSHYVIFRKPIVIVPDEILPTPAGEPPRMDIVKRHRMCQPIRPDQARAILEQGLGRDHPIMLWLGSSDFDEGVLGAAARGSEPPRTGGGKGKSRKGSRGRSASPASAEYSRYVMENEIRVTPRHHDLQSRFVTFVKKGKLGGAVEADLERVDVRYTDPQRGPVFAEIKPADGSTVRYAIRTAIGQLLDYRQASGGNPEMLVVVGCEPEEAADRELALSNGFGLAWPDTDGKRFVVRWPDYCQDKGKAVEARPRNQARASVD